MLLVIFDVLINMGYRLVKFAISFEFLKYRMNCKYSFQGAMTLSGKPPGGGSRRRYWRRLAHLLDHENYHYVEDLKALKAEVKRKDGLIENLLEVVDSFQADGCTKKPKAEHC